ncbi:hypothetical protein CYJ73_16305 [Gordonia terrae]|uniref:Uncharacterized protein n=1 Tax=Gordonia terrae TaxID=2055 RepID=A0A2I1R5N2_9ACTN|nr:hypothetical protein CYJ73_16305 [Gordonia terrae]
MASSSGTPAEISPCAIFASPYADQALIEFTSRFDMPCGMSVTKLPTRIFSGGGAIGRTGGATRGATRLLINGVYGSSYE